MKAISVALLILASVLVIHFALGAPSNDLPRGVAPGNWIPVSDKMGFVVTTPHTFPGPGGDRQALLVSAPTEGYFMVRAGDSWQRIAIKDPLIGPTG
jgi:hypothetical protein